MPREVAGVGVPGRSMVRSMPGNVNGGADVLQGTVIGAAGRSGTRLGSDRGIPAKPAGMPLWSA